MSAAKHTPGPWSWGYDPNDRTAMPILSSAVGEVCNFGDCERYYPTEGSPPNIADSKLIAAAPELLNELINLTARFKAAVMQAGTDEEFAELAVASARAAIAKAEVQS